MQEGGHLRSGDWLVGAVAEGVGVASEGDAGGGEGVDVGLVGVAFGVCEPGGGWGWG